MPCYSDDLGSTFENQCSLTYTMNHLQEVYNEPLKEWLPIPGKGEETMNVTEDKNKLKNFKMYSDIPSANSSNLFTAR